MRLDHSCIDAIGDGTGCPRELAGMRPELRSFDPYAVRPLLQRTNLSIAVTPRGGAARSRVGSLDLFGRTFHR
jgi:hypothetical protein